MATKKTVEKDEVIHNDISKIKQELSDYAKEVVDTEVEITIKKAEKRLIKHKNFIIIKRDIIIVILLLLSGYLTFVLYKNNYFEKYIPVNNKIETATQEESIKDNKKDDKKKLIKEYSKILDNIKIYTSSKNLSDFYKGNLVSKIKLELASANLKEEDITIDDKTYFIDSSNLLDEYIHLFGINDFKNESFTFQNIEFKYIKKLDVYMGEEVPKELISKIIHMPIDIELRDENMGIYSIEYYKKDNYIYNVLNNKKIGEYQDDNSIIENKEKLTLVKYDFEKLNDSWIFVGVKEV